jgi:hypothetical protein
VAAAPSPIGAIHVNIFLIPYTWLRHLSMALWCAGAGLLAWWAALTWVVWIGPSWPPEYDGPILMCVVSGAVACASVLGECNLRRLPMLSRLWRVALATGLSVAFTGIWYTLWHSVGHALLFTAPDAAGDAADASLVSLRFRLGAFAMGGLSCGIGPLIVRKGAHLVPHLVGGIASGLAGGLAWHLFNFTVDTDLYVAGAMLGATWGFTYGLLAWPIPDALYAGWLRVLSANRFGRRIPIDSQDGSPKERFVGHFPRGLDLFQPMEDGVMELHLSVAVDSKQRYKARGLSLAPTVVRRLLERVDLRYDPRRPAPLETRLSSGDRIRMSTQGGGFSEVEFVMLPREEQ